MAGPSRKRNLTLPVSFVRMVRKMNRLLRPILGKLFIPNATFVLLLSGCSAENIKGEAVPVPMPVGGIQAKDLSFKKNATKEVELAEQRHKRTLTFRERERKIFERAKTQDQYSDANNARLTFAGRDEIALVGRISLDGSMIVIERLTGDKGTCAVFNLVTGAAISEFPRERQGYRDTVFSSDGSVLVTSGLERRITVWDSSTGKMKKQIPVQGDFCQLVVTPDGKQAATLSLKPHFWSGEKWTIEG
jgi:hypothetical protein